MPGHKVSGDGGDWIAVLPEDGRVHVHSSDSNIDVKFSSPKQMRALSVAFLTAALEMEAEHGN